MSFFFFFFFFSFVQNLYIFFSPFLLTFSSPLFFRSYVFVSHFDKLGVCITPTTTFLDTRGPVCFAPFCGLCRSLFVSPTCDPGPPDFEM